PPELTSAPGHHAQAHAARQLTLYDQPRPEITSPPSRGASSNGARTRLPSTVRPVHVTSVVDAKHDDLASFVVHSIQASIGASASTEDARQLVAQLTTDPMRILDEHAGDELDDG